MNQEAMVLKIILWAQRHNRKLEDLTKLDVKLAIQNK